MHSDLSQTNLGDHLALDATPDEVVKLLGPCGNVENHLSILQAVLSSSEPGVPFKHRANLSQNFLHPRFGQTFDTFEVL